MSAQEKIAPVQGWPQGIPWSLHLEAYAVYCQKWGAQEALIDLEGRNCRGGFAVNELDQFIPGWRERVSEIYKLREAIAKKDATEQELRQALQACVDALKSAKSAIKGREHTGFIDAAITKAKGAL